MKSKKKLWKKILGTLLAASLAVGLMPGMTLMVRADESWTYPTSAPANPYDGGDGSETSPYEISTAQQLANFSYMVNNSQEYDSYTGKYFKLTADIDLKGKQWNKQWKMISDPDSDDGCHFNGIFDGDDHTISGLYIKNDNYSGEYHAGLFKYIGKDAIIRNLTVDGEVTGIEHVAGIACDMEGKIENCVNKANVNAVRNDGQNSSHCIAGGIAGRVFYGIVNKCYNIGKITVNRSVTRTPDQLNGAAGIAAYVWNGKVTNCYNIGEIEEIGDEGETDYVHTSGVVISLEGREGECSYCHNYIKNLKNVFQRVNGPTVKSCFYLADASGEAEWGETPLSAADFSDMSKFTAQGWSTSIWKMKEDTSKYPVFQPSYIALKATKPTITMTKLDGVNSSDAPQIGDTLLVKPDPEDAAPVTYQWYRGNEAISEASGASYTVAKEDVDSKLHVVISQAKDSGGSGIPADDINVKSDDTKAVEKKDGPKAPENIEETGFKADYQDEIYEINDNYEVSSTKTDTITSVTKLTDILDSDEHKIYIRKKAEDDVKASAWIEYTLTSRSDAPTGLTTEDASDASTADGKIKGTNEKMEYKLKNSDGSWTTASSSETKVKAGRYLVRFKAADNTPASKAVELNVAIEGSEGIGIILTEDQKPTKKTGLVFDHSEQALVNAGKAALPSGYTMKYALGNDKVSAPTSGWTTSIPKGLEPKTYYVWFKAVGEAESEAECIEVTIGKSEEEQEYEKLMPVLKIVKKDTIAIETTDGYEYSIDGGDTWTSSGSFTNLSPGTDYTICMRKQDTTDIIGSIFVTTAKDDKTSTTIEMKDVVKTGDGYIRTETRIEGDAAVAGVANLDADFVLDLLSKDEKGKEELEKIRNGAALLVYMQVSNADESASEEDKKKIDDAAKNLNNAAVHQLINISLYKKIGNEEAEEISDFNSRTIGVTLEIPDELKKTESNEAEASALTEIESQSENMQVLAETEREFYIAGVNGDKAEIIDSTTSDDGNTISFEAEKFCMTYALLYSDSEVEPTPGEETQKTQSANERILVVKNKSDISRLFSKYGETGYKYKFKIENKAQKAIMTVSKKGRIKVKKPGTATIALLRKVKGGYWAKVEEQTLTAEKPDLPKKITNLKVGDTVYAASFIKNTMVSSPTSYISSKSKIASIDSSTGKITIHKSGTAKITIIYGSGKGAAKYNVKIKIG